jgi:hypothetical protein
MRAERSAYGMDPARMVVFGTCPSGHRFPHLWLICRSKGNAALLSASVLPGPPHRPVMLDPRTGRPVEIPLEYNGAGEPAPLATVPDDMLVIPQNSEDASQIRHAPRGMTMGTFGRLTCRR